MKLKQLIRKYKYYRSTKNKQGHHNLNKRKNYYTSLEWANVILEKEEGRLVPFGDIDLWN